MNIRYLAYTNVYKTKALKRRSTNLEFFFCSSSFRRVTAMFNACGVIPGHKVLPWNYNIVDTTNSQGGKR